MNAIDSEPFYGIPIFRSLAGLLAFLLAFYALTARERRTPYILDSVYSTVALALITFAIAAVARVVDGVDSHWANVLEIAAIGALLVTTLYILYRVWRIHNRQMNFRDDNLIKNLKIVRTLKTIKRSIRPKQRFEHNSQHIPTELLAEIAQLDRYSEGTVREILTERQESTHERIALSILEYLEYFSEADERISRMIAKFVEHDCWVQYCTACRHPIEFVARAKEYVEGSGAAWDKVQRRMVIVDAYTPHYGFTDSIHPEQTKRVESTYGIHCITSRASYAGVHTAAAQAFNWIKQQSNGKPPREPTLVIYEGLSALSDIESIEQYRIFVRHVLPSERLWGGMLTVVVESALRGEEYALLRAYSDVALGNHGDSQQYGGGSGSNG